MKRSSEKKNIFFILDDFSGGGAARVISLISSELKNRGYNVSIVMDTSKDCIYDINKDINIISLFGKRSINGKYRRIEKLITIIKATFKIKRIIRDNKNNKSIYIGVLPSMALSLWLASIGSNIKKIASDHTSFERKLSRFARFIRSFVYSKFDKVTILTKVDSDYLGDKLPNKIVIPNPLSVEYCKQNCDREKVVLAVGRLDLWYEKGFDILLDAWKKIYYKYPEWRLQIAGTGKVTSYDHLKCIIRELDIENSVDLIGQQKNIIQIMRNSSIFTMTSRVEGFGLALVEAMSQGCACISFDCHGRQHEIVENSNQGILLATKDADTLANSLERLITDKSLRQKLSIGAVNRSKNFDVSKITNIWEKMLSNIS